MLRIVAFKGLNPDSMTLFSFTFPMNFLYYFGMKKLLFIFLVSTLIISCSDGNEILGSCYVSPNPEIICTEEYDPVCACNNLVYTNSCEAEKAGNLYYKTTNKDSGDDCVY